MKRKIVFGIIVLLVFNLFVTKVKADGTFENGPVPRFGAANSADVSTPILLGELTVSASVDIQYTLDK